MISECHWAYDAGNALPSFHHLFVSLPVSCASWLGSFDDFRHPSFSLSWARFILVLALNVGKLGITIFGTLLNQVNLC